MPFWYHLSHSPAHYLFHYPSYYPFTSRLATPLPMSHYPTACCHAGITELCSARFFQQHPCMQPAGYSLSNSASLSSSVSYTVSDSRSTSVSASLQPTFLQLKLLSLTSMIANSVCYTACEQCSLDNQHLPSNYFRDLDNVTTLIRVCDARCPENAYTDQFRWIDSYNPEQPVLIFSQPHPDESVRVSPALCSAAPHLAAEV